MTRDVGIRDPRELFDIGPQILGAQSAVQPDGNWLRVTDRVPERLCRLPRERPAALIRDGAGNHDRHIEIKTFLRNTIDRKQGGFAVQGIEDRFRPG